MHRGVPFYKTPIPLLVEMIRVRDGDSVHVWLWHCLKLYTHAQFGFHFTHLMLRFGRGSPMPRVTFIPPMTSLIVEGDFRVLPMLRM